MIGTMKYDWRIWIKQTKTQQNRARFLSLTQSKLRLCLANHRAGYFSNLACDWLSTVWAYSEQETENGPSLHNSWDVLYIDAVQYNGQFSPKSSQQTPHSSPVRLSYGLSVVSTSSGLCSIAISLASCRQYHIISYIISFHIISFHIIYHIISYHISYQSHIIYHIGPHDDGTSLYKGLAFHP